MGNLQPGTLEWQDGLGGHSRRFDHVVTRETGGVAAFEADLEIEQPTKKVLEIGPATPWTFRPDTLDLPDEPDPEDDPVAVPAVDPANSQGGR